MQHDLSPEEIIRQAALWLASTPRQAIEGPVVPALRQRFPLSAQEACEACAMAAAIRKGGADA